LKNKIKTWHWIIFLLLLLLAFRIELIVDCLIFWEKYISLVFSDFSTAIQLLDLNTLEILFAPLLIILIGYLVIKHRTKSFLSATLKFTPAFTVLLLFVFLFAPIITNRNPDFQKDLSVTKLLPPFSRVISISFDEKESGKDNSSIFDLKKKIIPPSFNEKGIFVDSVSSDQKKYYKGKKEYLIADLFDKLNDIKIETKNYLLGTDEFGRDVMTRLIFGTRISLLVGLTSVLVSLFIGIVLGFIAAYSHGIIDTTLNRFAEVMLAFPVIYLVVLILALFGSSLISIVIVLGLSGWMSLFKIVRSEILALKTKDYIMTSGLIGLSKTQILLKEIIPVIIIPVVVNTVFQFSNVILAESALSYLGLTVGGNYPSWGSMIESGQEYMRTAWWMIVFPGTILILTLFSFNNLGRKINEIFIPRTRQ
jgi:peptide/nickel transport system permease protein